MKIRRKKQKKREVILGHGERRDRLSVSLTKIRVHSPFLILPEKEAEEGRLYRFQRQERKKSPLPTNNTSDGFYSFSDFF